MRSLAPLVSLFVLSLTGCTSVQSKIEINAPADKVREVLFDFRQYPDWNPFIVNVDGIVVEGNTVNVTVKPTGKKPISGPTYIDTLKPFQLVWKGSLAVPGVFNGRHEFRIEEAGPNRSVFYNDEKMSGLIVPFYSFKATRSGFEAMNVALKQRAEQITAP
jgi:hypothetical protein